jgi:UDP-N-acetylmuramyl pentapeptide phosphotransferase/UDP-N-acetylglucosamine-1-phosphate transferase
MHTLVIAFLISLIATYSIVRYRHLHQHISGDHDLTGIQKFHSFSVPRIGGVGVFIGVFVALLMRWIHTTEIGEFGLLLLFSALPAFLVGVTEDFTKKISINFRLFAIVVAALIAGYLLDSWIINLEISFMSLWMKQYPWLSIMFTCFAVTGVANAFNIIDGYNGLSGTVAVIILGAIVYVAFQVGDISIMVSALAVMGAILGFLVWNYPRGLIFLGDGGAYFIGFWIAELSILLTIRNSAVSVWFPFLICIYPIFETIFSMYRRIVLHKSHPGAPDSSHLHHLIYKRVVRWAVGSRLPADELIRNSLTSPYLWVMCLLSVIPAVLFWRNTNLLQLFSMLFILSYVILYRMLVKFSAPKWMTLNFKRLK